MSKQYKVQGSVLPADKLKGEHIVQSRTISQWVNADSPLNAACKFIMDNDEVNSSPVLVVCLLYTSPSPRDRTRSRMPSSA